MGITCEGEVYADQDFYSDLKSLPFKLNDIVLKRSMHSIEFVKFISYEGYEYFKSNFTGILHPGQSAYIEKADGHRTRCKLSNLFVPNPQRFSDKGYRITRKYHLEVPIFKKV